jgi:cobalt-zinc-cadmium efflux system outer membrane protein
MEMQFMLQNLWRRDASSILSCLLIIIALTANAFGQNHSGEVGIVSSQRDLKPSTRPQLITESLMISFVSSYFDPAQGSSSSDLVRRAITSNAELSAARLEIERARARMRQSSLFPNPTIDFEHTTGQMTGSPAERETSLGVNVPLELFGQRRSRINLAQVEIKAAEAEVADRERRLSAEVRAAYSEAMAAINELQITAELNNLDVKTARIVEVRVTEGDASPLESNLLQVEIERLKSRRTIVEGRLQAAMLKLKTLAGIPPAEVLKLREELASPVLAEPSDSMEAAVAIALNTRPDLKLARLVEEMAQAGLNLAKAQAAPGVTLFSRYTVSQSQFDNTPVGPLRDKDRLFTFGVSIGIPLFNRNQGAKAEAEVAILQARRRREFVETMVKSEVMTAYARYEAAKSALMIYREGVLARSSQNIRSIRGAYEIGAFRITDLLVEQRRFIDFQREFIEAQSERFRALTDLRMAVGIPDAHVASEK